MRATVQVTFLLLAAVLRQGNALRCWDCASNTSPECDDPITYSDHNVRFHTKDCDQSLGQHPYSYESPVCRKTVQIVNGNRIVIRACAMPLPDERDITDGVCSKVPAPSHVITESCHLCTTDLCNGGHSVAGGHATILTSLLLGISSIVSAYRWSC